jgi:predicted dehydrogenase
MTVATRPRLGFAGLGWIGKNRMEAVAQSGLAEVAAVFDPFVTTSNQQPATSNFDELCESDVDAIVIATPSALHADQAVAALERGKAVFCQKPLGRNGEETRRVVDAARANDRLLGVDLSYRHTAALQKVRELVGSGELGEIFAADLVFHNAFGPDKPWFYDPKLSGGGCVIDLGIHLVDAALWILGFPRVKRVTSRLFGLPVEHYATARIDLATGASLQLACSWNLSAGRDAVIGATFYGTRGAAAMRNVSGSFYDFTAEHYEKTHSRLLVEPPDAWGGRAIIAFVERLQESPRFDPRIEQLVDVAETLDRIYSCAS